MLRNKPRLNYNGLTLVLSNPSRADNINLLSAGGGRLMNECLQPEYNLYQCDIRVKEDNSPLLDGTKVVMLLGEDAAKQWLRNPDNTIGEIRGSVYLNNNIPFIASFFPQDAVDIKDYESKHNANKTSSAEEREAAYIHYESDDNDGEDALSEKKHGKTKRKNYRFWLQKDVERVKYLLKNDGHIPKEPEPVYHIYPSADVVIRLLQETKDQFFYFDCETDENLNITCFAFSFGFPNIYVVPCIDHNYNWSYDCLPKLLRALAIAIHNNIIVAHNGASFDFFVLAHKYRIGVNKCYDTMLAQHRCYPDVEKSLGHCMSIWTWQPYHKDENAGWYNAESVKNTLKYCGKDVYGMMLVHLGIMEYASKHPGLPESIEQAMESIRPYLITTLLGIKVLPNKREEMFKENDALMLQYNRMIYMLIGPTATAELRKRSKNSMAGSNQQCAKYFHEMLGYDIMKRSPKTGEPSLGKKQMYQLALKYNNPVIPVIMAYRELSKESGSLKWNCWQE